MRVSSESNGALDAIDDDADDEHAHGEVEQDARFHEQRRRMDEQQAEQVDAVLEDQVTADLRDGLHRPMSRTNPVSTEASAPGTRSERACSGSSGSARAIATAAIVPPAPSSSDGTNR